MVTKKILLSIATISILYSGCTEEKKTEEKKVTVPIQKTQTPQETTTPTTIAENIIEQKEEKIVKPQIEEPIQKIVIAPNATSLFKKCIACHGKNAEKKALNQSEIIKDWSAEKISNALKGYKDGSYGGTMKGLMKSQVATLSDQDIELLSHHIADFQ